MVKIMKPGLKSIPVDERPRERLLRHGPRVLSDAELLAVLLRTGTQGQSVLELSRALLKDGWDGLSRRSWQELMQTKGMGESKSALLLAVLEIGHRIRRQTRINVGGPEDIVTLLGEMGQLDQEEFRIVLLNTKGDVLGIETLFVGGLDGVEVYPREIFRRAVARSAASIIVAHNHPSGDPTPSREDRRLTERLEQAGSLMGIPIVDHVIIGRSRHMSLHHGEMTELN